MFCSRAGKLLYWKNLISWCSDICLIFLPRRSFLKRYCEWYFDSLFLDFLSKDPVSDMGKDGVRNIVEEPCDLFFQSSSSFFEEQQRHPGSGRNECIPLDGWYSSNAILVNGFESLKGGLSISSKRIGSSTSIGP